MSETDGGLFLDISEVARLIGVSRFRAYRMAAEGVFPVARLSPRRIRVPRAAFEAWVAAVNADAAASVQAHR